MMMNRHNRTEGESCYSHFEVLISKVIGEVFRCMVAVSNYAISSSSRT
jgi:hypothetical protein